MPLAAIIFLVVEFLAVIFVALAITAWIRKAPERYRRTWWAVGTIGIAVATFGGLYLIEGEVNHIASVAAVLLALAALGWCVWTLLVLGRSRGRRRCPKCWYDMIGTEGLRCPECGRTAKREEHLFRTRRHGRLSLLSLIPSLLAIYLALLPRVQQHGWPAALPTTALIWCMKIDNNEWVFLELGRRALEVNDPAMRFYLPREGALYEWQWRAIGESCIELVESDRPLAERDGFLYWLRMVRYHLRHDPVAEEINATFVRLLDDNDPGFRGSAALLVADPAEPEASISRLRPLFNDADADVRRCAVIALRHLVGKSDEPVELATKALDDEVALVRDMALMVIRRAAEVQEIPAHVVSRVRAMDDDPDASVRESQMLALFEFTEDMEVRRAIVEATLLDDDVARRRAAWQQIGGEDGFDASDYLRELLIAIADLDADVRMLAAALLRHDIEIDELVPHEATIAAAIDPLTRPETANDLQEILVELHDLRTEQLLNELEMKEAPAQPAAQQ